MIPRAATNAKDRSHGRLKELQSVLDSPNNQPAILADTVEPNSPAAIEQSVYHGEGSVKSIARLVEDAVLFKTPEETKVGAEFHDVIPKSDNGRLNIRPASFSGPEESGPLLKSYLNGSHQLHPFLERSKLLIELETVHSEGTPHNDPSAFRLFMVFAIGAASMTRSGKPHPTSSFSYYAAAMDCGRANLGLSSLEDIQAILLILIFSIHHDVGIGKIWDLARLAMRICVENKYHRQESLPRDPMQAQIQKRVFWACYINDRHSSSMLGRPLALQDEEIDVEVPLDADDDLVASGNVSSQFMRGFSEVLIQLRHIRLRQITSCMRVHLFKLNPETPCSTIHSMGRQTLSRLDHWRSSYPLLLEPRSVYESKHWRDLNFEREQLRCFRFLVLLEKRRNKELIGPGSYLDLCLKAASQVAALYRQIQGTDKLVMNWTCVHDVLNAGFTALYCGLVHGDLERPWNDSVESWNQAHCLVLDSITSITETLTYISQRWAVVEKHLRVFKMLSGRVSGAMQARHLLIEQSLGLQEQAQLGDAEPNVPEFDAGLREETIPLENLDWSHVDWDHVDWEAILGATNFQEEAWNR
ncbi:hypothetical protein NM208_g5782 [Fusarium decemcellulare]|uniref:Uncharacterized protein n=1 Tax=Fusarium decemcellulare TaxID=57161 RepID=A0ACC1SFR3_9HYPO|nr:hypothetical protein NM208_g5782 [Fusarium decemcellulare]